MTFFFSLFLASMFVMLTLIRTRWTSLALFDLVLGTACFSLFLQCLSLGQAISFPAVRWAVIVSIIISSIISFLLFRSLEETPLPDDKKAAGLWKADLLNNGIVAGLFTALVAGILLIILTATAYTALMSVPNNWDSMTYHLPRIEHWLQDRSLAFYTTNNSRQNESGILAEEGILALRSWNHAYPIANLVQWLSFGGCIVLAGRIAGQIGGARSAQYLASVLVATIPMAILQASSTQTDLVVAFFSMTSLYFLLQVKPNGPYSQIYGFVIAGALAYLVKGTAWIFLSGFIFVYGIRLTLQRPSWKTAPHLFLAGALGLAVLAGHELRLLHAYGTFIGPSSAETATVHPGWRSTVFNVVRNFASNLNIKNDAARSNIDSLVIASGRALGILDTDGHYSWFSAAFHVTHPIIEFHEDSAMNMNHATLILIVMFALFGLLVGSHAWRTRNWSIIHYGFAVALSMVAFCAFIKWQPWITRLQLGEFVLAMPLVAIALASFLGIIMPLLVIFFGWQAEGPTFYNLSRPIFNRPLYGDHSILDRGPVEVLFYNRPDLEKDYVHIADIVASRRPKELGVRIGGNGWEFPLWFLLRQRLAPAEMPIITYQMNDDSIDPRIDMLVSADYGHPAIKDMREAAGSGQVFLYERQN